MFRARVKTREYPYPIKVGDFYYYGDENNPWGEFIITGVNSQYVDFVYMCYVEDEDPEVKENEEYVTWSMVNQNLKSKFWWKDD